jgi:hypothetical protein
MHVATADAGNDMTDQKIQENNMSGFDWQHDSGEKTHAAI